MKIENGRRRSGMVTCRVPQGSILGPILSSIHINYSSDLQFRDGFYTFVSDVVVVHRATIQKLLLANTIRDLNLITSWYYNNKLHINGKKTELMTFG